MYEPDDIEIQARSIDNRFLMLGFGLKQSKRKNV